MAKIPLNPEVLRWALADAGVDVEQISEETHKPISLVESWLSGLDKPHGGDLRKISLLVGRSPLFFSLKKPPREIYAAADFRKPIGLNAHERSLNSLERKALRSAQGRQKIAAWASENQSDGLPSLPLYSSSAKVSAEHARVWLGWTASDQVNASSKAGCFSLLRNRTEATGVMVTLQSLGTDSYRGFSIPNPRVPLIAINKSFKIGSIHSYTLLHELAHLIRGEEAICDAPDNKVERWCDQFAAIFLMPEDHLRAYASKWLKQDHFDNTDLDSVRRISNRYKASYHAVAIRLKELGMANQGLVDFIRQGHHENPEKGGPSGELQTTPVIRVREFGAVFTRLIIDSVDSQRMNPLDAQKYLNVGQSELLEMATRVRHAE